MKRKYLPRIEALFSYKTLLLIAFGVIINVFFPRLVISLNFPLYLDNIGSIFCAAVGGAIPGMVTAFVSNYLGYFGEPSAIMFGVLTVIMAFLATKVSERGLLRKPSGYFLLFGVMILVGGAGGSILGWYLYGKTVGGTIATPYVFWLCRHGFSGFGAQFLGDMILDVTDKAITVTLAALLLHSFPKKLRGAFPLSYLYSCTDEELEAAYVKLKEPYEGCSIYNKIMRIISSSLITLSVLVTLYCTIRYLINLFSKTHNTHALFSYVVQLMGIEFVIITFVMVFAGYLTFQTLKKPLDAIIRQSMAFGNSAPEKWLESEEWKNRSVINTKDEVQVLYETICHSEESIAQKVISIRENEAKLRRLSETDLMTGIKNRGSGEQEIISLINNNIKGLFCLLDCDHFKQINDTYGHIAGDQVLVAIAEALKQICRSSDICLRLGGDEFALYLPEILSRKQADAFFGRLFEGISKIDIPALDKTKIFISLGAAFNHQGSSISFDTLYRNADLALYQSKETDGFCATIYGRG